MDNLCKLHEECAVFGVSTKELQEAAGITYNGLLALQHRGQEGAGIAVLSGNKIIYQKNAGLVAEVFSNQAVSKLPKSRVAVGHCRYSTTGTSSNANIQPFVTEYLTGRIATVHNGNLVNAKVIRQILESRGVRFTATSDSEVISSLVAYETIREGNDVIKGVKNAGNILSGAFSLCILSGDGKLIAMRDPWGFRPLCIGRNEWGLAVASETCGLDAQDFEFIRDVEPGEIIVIENGEITYTDTVKTDHKSSLCIFEYVYFARPDSVVDELSVYEARYNMGRTLAIEHPAEADVVCGVPDSGLEAAAGFAAQSGIPLASGFVKNRYMGRSFIFPTQAQREKAVRLKLNPLAINVKGKRVVLVDDSIVRGTTCARIIKSLRDAGAKEIHFRVSSPPFRHTCHFGTDVDSEDKLIANQMSIEEIRKKIDADSLGYISLEGMKKACTGCKLDFCVGCFTGFYNVGFDDLGINKQELEETK